MAKLTGLYNYPLKGCRAIPNQHIAIDRKGLHQDRVLALCSPEGRLITARNYPKLAGIEVASLTSDRLIVRHEGKEYNFQMEASDSTHLKHFDKNFDGHLLQSEANTFFSHVLNSECVLTTNHPERARVLNPKYGKHEWEVRMVDSSPILLINQASVDALNHQLEFPVDPLCFRPNVIVDGLAAEAEFELKHLRIGDISFEVNSSCKRCRLTTLDLELLEFRKDGEPLKTLSSYERNRSGGIEFGIYLLPLNQGNLQLGDELIIS